MHHNAKHGCSRCTVVGEFHSTSHTTVFKRFDAPLRTNDDFRNNVYLGTHQVEASPLIEIQNVDMIKDFIVGDSLHLFDHGITQKLLTGFIKGTLGNIEAKWCQEQINMVSNYLLSIKAPSEIRGQRAIRNLNIVAKWKGIEFHNFALYVGIIVLNGNLPDYLYKHFLLYFCAYTIISSKRHLLSLSEVAEMCLKLFVERFKLIYGSHHFTMNLHNMLHVMEDVKRFGAINTFSTYPFEAYLFEIKRLLRSGHLPLTQIANRLIESEVVKKDHSKEMRKNLYPQFIGAPCSHKSDDLNNFIFVKYELYSVVKFEKFQINCMRDEDRYILTKDNKIIEVNYFVCFDGQTKIYGQAINDIKNYFELPIKSSEMLIFSSENLNKNPSELFEIDEILCKLFKMRRDKNFMYYANTERNVNEYVFIPLLNTIIDCN